MEDTAALLNAMPGFLVIIIALLWIIFPVIVISMSSVLVKMWKLQKKQNEYLHVATNALLDLSSEVRNSVGSPTAKQKPQTPTQRY